MRWVYLVLLGYHRDDDRRLPKTAKANAQVFQQSITAPLAYFRRGFTSWVCGPADGCRFVKRAANSKSQAGVAAAVTPKRVAGSGLRRPVAEPVGSCMWVALFAVVSLLSRLARCSVPGRAMSPAACRSGN
jgi:hypothetical protein